MPRLSEVGDTEAVDTRYASKVVIYVEAETDAVIYYGLAGNGIRELLEFKVPTSLETGAHAVASEVERRRPQYPRTFGLIDGEDAAKFGGIDELLQCRSTMFQIPGTDQGLIFLGLHEAENVLILHGKLAELIRRDRPILAAAGVSDPAIAEQITSTVRRFFQAALVKYASMTFNHRANQLNPKTGGKVIDSARFLAPEPVEEIVAKIKVTVEAEGIVSWSDLMAEVKRTWTVVREEFVRARPDSDICQLERLRLTDGKSVVNKLARLSSADPTKWSNHLLEDAKQSTYAVRFREELVAITRAAA